MWIPFLRGECMVWDGKSSFFVCMCDCSVCVSLSYHVFFPFPYRTQQSADESWHTVWSHQQPAHSQQGHHGLPGAAPAEVSSGCVRISRHHRCCLSVSGSWALLWPDVCFFTAWWIAGPLIILLGSHSIAAHRTNYFLVDCSQCIIICTAQETD